MSCSRAPKTHRHKTITHQTEPSPLEQCPSPLERPEPSPLEQCPILLLRPLLTSGDNQHLQVEELLATVSLWFLGLFKLFTRMLILIVLWLTLWARQLRKLNRQGTK
jgi:hypothetical protein